MRTRNAFGKNLPKYRKHRASGKAVVSLSGRDFYLGPHGTRASKAEYDRLVGEWMANGRRMTGPDNTITVTELVSAYWNFAQGYYVKNGKQTDEVSGVKVALRYFRESYGPQFIDEIGPLALAAVRNKMIDAGNTRRYINQQIGRIKRCVKWGVSQELVPVEVHQALATLTGLRRGKSKAKEASPILPVPETTVEATITECSETVGAMIRFQMLTGCRPGELFSMRPTDIDRTEKVWHYRPASHKMEHRDRQVSWQGCGKEGKESSGEARSCRILACFPAQASVPVPRRNFFSADNQLCLVF